MLNKIKSKIKILMSINESPKKLALSFGIGVFIAISPLWGLHTFIGLGLALLFDLNKLVLMIGIYVTNPWTVIPIYTFTTWCGIKIMGKNITAISIDWKNITFSSFFEAINIYLWPFVIGSTIIGIIAGLVGGIIVYYYFKRRQLLRIIAT
jgi:hypothetical protein